jgi:hypothetical protein
MFAFEYHRLSSLISLPLPPHFHSLTVKSSETPAKYSPFGENAMAHTVNVSFEGADGRPIVCTAVVGIVVNSVVVRGECQYLFVHHDEQE